MMNRRNFFTATLLILCAVAAAGFAAPYDVQLKSGTITPAAGQFDIPDVPAVALNDDVVHAAIQLYEPLGRGDRARFASAGIMLLDYMPDRAYTAAIRRGTTVETLSNLGVRSVFALRLEDKIHPRILDGNLGEWSKYGVNERIFTIYLMKDTDIDQAAARLEAEGFKTGTEFELANALFVACYPQNVFELAAMDFVLFIEESPPPLSPVNNIVRQRLNVDSLHNAPYNLTGDGVTILIYDGGIADSSHPDFGNRMVMAETNTVAGHATHVAGTVGGDGTQSGGLRRGMAPGVSLVTGLYDLCSPYCFYDSPNDVSDDFVHARTVFNVELTTASLGANIDPNSYDCDWFGDYEVTSHLLDSLVRNTGGMPLTQFWAAGNERNGTSCGVSTYECISVPASAKNIITVGATTQSDAPASFSSWGPTDDGRIKPEVVATGVDVTSCAPGPGYGYTSMSGTSMATPATSGVACLLLEAWHNMFPGSPDPLPETIKALLINSTTDVQSTGPDYRTGFGLVNATKAVRQLQDGGVFESAIESGEEFAQVFFVFEGTQSIDVSLAWSDVPAAGNVIPTLVNDLNLQLVGPGAEFFEPWVLDPDNPGSAATTGEDHINVCERVHVNNPTPGLWFVHVNGTLNGSESQTFALATSFPLVNEWATIQGQITDDGGPGIPGQVRVVGGSQMDLSDATGNYQISVPGNATYDVRAVAYGFVPEQAPVSVTSGSTVRDFDLENADNGTVNGTVRNQFGDELENVVVTFLFPNATIPAETTDANGNYSIQLPGANDYGVAAEFRGRVTGSSVSVPENGTATLDIEINDSRFLAAGPDNHGYYCYEEGDSGLAAEYSYSSILPSEGGSGTVLAPGAGNDWTTQLTLPFTVTYYGQDYTTVTVSADGWVGFGTTDGGAQPWTNVGIPTAGTPNGMICVFWDDLYPYHPTEGGEIAFYNDAANGRYIIEYFEVPHFTPTTNKVTAQLIIYDQETRPTVTLDNEFDILYERFDYFGAVEDADATIGCEAPNGADGLQTVYGGGWHANDFDLTAPGALRFTTGIFSGFGSVQGEIIAHPMLPDMSVFELTFGDYTINPNADGTFFADSIVSRSYRMTVSYTGYETLESEQFFVSVDDTATVNFDVWRLDPATNLTGEFFPAVNEIRLAWDGPTWDAILGRDPQGNPLDDFVAFDVNIQGRGVVGSTPADTFTYSPPTVGNYNIWITVRYDGGTSDTSNHVRILVLPNAADNLPDIPETYYLSQNYPNPFNPETQIEFGLPQASHVTLEVFDVLGRKVAVLADGQMAAGRHSVEFRGTGLGTGLYFYRISAGEFHDIRKMLFVR